MPANGNADDPNKMTWGQFFALLFALLILYGVAKPALYNWLQSPAPSSATSNQDGSNRSQAPTGHDSRINRTPGVGPVTGAHPVPDGDPLHGPDELPIRDDRDNN
jgi:hypothetical protein